MFHDQPARGDQRGDLGVAELAQQAPDIAVNRLLPGVLARIEVAAYQTGVNARIDGRGVKSQQSALAVAGDADLAFRRLRCLSQSTTARIFCTS